MQSFMRILSLVLAVVVFMLGMVVYKQAGQQIGLFYMLYSSVVLAVLPFRLSEPIPAIKTTRKGRMSIR